MTMQNYSTVLSRNLIRAEGAFLKHAEDEMVLSLTGDHKEQPLNKTDTVVFRRVKPLGAGSNEVRVIDPADFAASEGTTPNARTIDYVDVSVQVKHWVVLFKFSSAAEYMYEDDIPSDMKEETGQTMGTLMEMIAYGKMRAGTSVVYSNGTTRAGINTKIGENMLNRVQRTLEGNRGKMVTKMIQSGIEFGREGVEPAYLVYVSTDAKADCRALAGFTKRVDYGGGGMSAVHAREFGAWNDFRFISSPLFTPHLGAGSATLNSMLYTSANVDVYTSVILGQNAVGHVSLKGHGHTGISPTIISSKIKNHANPAGMFGYVGADFWANSARLNENFMCRAEHACSALA